MRGQSYPYRQNGHFLYFAGHAIPNMALLAAPDEDLLFGYKQTVADIVWSSPLPTLESWARRWASPEWKTSRSLEQFLIAFRAAPTLHYLPPYRGDTC